MSKSTREMEIILKSFPANYVEVIGPVNCRGLPLPVRATPAPPPKPPKKKKENEKKGGGARRKPKNFMTEGVGRKKTRYALWGSYLAIYGCVLNIVMAAMLFLWGVTEPKEAPWLGNGLPSEFGGLQWIAVFYTFAFCAGFVYYELYNEKSIRNGGVEYRNKLMNYAVAIFLGPLPCMLALPTLLGAAHIMIASVMFYVAYKNSENFDGIPKKRKRKNVVTLTAQQRFVKVYGGKDIAARSGRMVVLTIYFAGTAFYGLLNAINAQKGIDDAPPGSPKSAFTVWVPVAKFFGGVMNINFSLILLPVCRTFVSKLYDFSTGDQTMASSRCARSSSTPSTCPPLAHALRVGRRRRHAYSRPRHQLWPQEQSSVGGVWRICVGDRSWPPHHVRPHSDVCATFRPKGPPRALHVHPLPLHPLHFFLYSPRKRLDWTKLLEICPLTCLCVCPRAHRTLHREPKSLHRPRRGYYVQQCRQLAHRQKLWPLSQGIQDWTVLLP